MGCRIIIFYRISFSSAFVHSSTTKRQKSINAAQTESLTFSSKCHADSIMPSRVAFISEPW